MHKTLFVVLVVGMFVIGCTGPAEDAVRATVQNESGPETMSSGTVMIDIDNSEFIFEGFGPGKSHVGEFTDWSGELLLNEEAVVGADITIEVSSLDTGIGGLDSHLRGEDFFEVETYPEASFVSRSIVDGVATGNLTLKGITNTIQFPVNVSGQEVEADFIISMSDWNISHPATNDEARIAFSVVPEPQ